MIENYRTTPTRVFKISSVYLKVFGMVLCSCKHEEWRMEHISISFGIRT